MTKAPPQGPAEQETLLHILGHRPRASGVKVHQVCTLSVPPTDQFALWRDATKDAGFVERPEASDAAFHAVVTSYLTPAVGYTWYGAWAPSMFHRDRRHVERYGADALLVQLRRSGEELSNSFDHGRLFLPGTVRIADLARPIVSVNTSHENIAIAIRKSQLYGRVPGLDRLHGLMLPDTPMTGFLKAHMTSTLELLPSISAKDTEHLTTVTTELIAATLLSVTTPDILGAEGMESAAVTAMRHYIDTHLDDPDLCPERIARAIGVSRAKLFLLSKPYGKPMELVRHRRLQKAFELLKTGGGASVTNVAFEVGFENRETFSRAFKREFGISARDILQAREAPLYN